MIAILFILLLAAPLYAADAPKCYAVTTFDGAKLKARYGITNDDFKYRDGQLCLRTGLVLPDDPPILEQSDTPAVYSRNLAKAQIDREKALRAIVLLVLDEFNAHANKINAILTAIDGANSLAEVKAAIAAIPDHPQRTSAQLLTAIKNSIDSGAAD